MRCRLYLLMFTVSVCPSVTNAPNDPGSALLSCSLTRWPAHTGVMQCSLCQTTLASCFFWDIFNKPFAPYSLRCLKTSNVCLSCSEKDIFVNNDVTVYKTGKLNVRALFSKAVGVQAQRYQKWHKHVTFNLKLSVCPYPVHTKAFYIWSRKWHHGFKLLVYKEYINCANSFTLVLKPVTQSTFA